MAATYPFESRRGEVTAFDGHAGRGTVTDRDGLDWFFHCTRIADGSRVINLGALVAFDVVAGNLGEWEAANVRPAPARGSSPRPA
ncbi:MAG TPA: cold shock domain-containing protein [Acidimicrobiales bacterium]|jgi:cold shock CspA family protein|nr:cold shock domain-containing protein [Acidimicrobiales bacterium]